MMTNIFLQYDADGLERQYMPAHWPNVDPRKTAAKWDGFSDPFYARTKVIEDVAYGDSDRERIDLFLSATGASSAPVLAFIHGGYWRSLTLTKRNYSFCFEPIVAAGALACQCIKKAEE